MVYMRNAIIKILVCVCVGFLGMGMTSCDTSIDSEPMLKITTSTSFGMFPATKTNYYIIYENGVVRKTTEFVPSNIIYYFFNSNGNYEDSTLLHINDDDPLREKLNNIANNIRILMDESKFENISIGRLYVLSERYFFNIGYNDGEKRVSKLFEYISADSSAKEIAILTGKGNLDHAELYSS